MMMVHVPMLMKANVIVLETFLTIVEFVMDLVQYTNAVALKYQKEIVIVMETF